MLFKSVLAAAAVSAIAILTPLAAHADPQIGVSIGFGYGDFSPEPDPHFRGPEPFWNGDFHRHPRHRFGRGPGYPDPAMTYGFSCASAANVVRAAGFRGVQATDCSRPVYGYEAWKHGEIFRVNVSMGGRIVAVEPLY